MRRTMALEARRLSTFIVRRPSRRPLACFCECVFGVHLGTPGVVFPAPNSPPWVPPSGARVAALVLSNYNYNYNYYRTYLPTSLQQFSRPPCAP